MKSQLMLMFAGASLQTIAMRGQQMVITYIVVLGLEAISAYCLGCVGSA